MIHLDVRSWFSFLAGASSPEKLVQTAASLGQEALALTDLHNVAGAVRFSQACSEAGINPLIGATLNVEGHPLVLLCANREGYATLCDLLTLSHLDENGNRNLHPSLTYEQLHNRTENLLCLTGDRDGLLATLVRSRECSLAASFTEYLQKLFPQRLFIELTHNRRPGDTRLMRDLSRLGREYSVPTVAAGPVRHATRDGYALYDAMLCAGLKVTIGDSHPLRPVNDECYLRSEEEMRELGFPTSAIANTKAIANLCGVNLLAEAVVPPHAKLPEGKGAATYLRELCCQAFRQRYPKGSQRATEVLKQELSVIHELELDEFFLVVREVIQFARSRGIRCSGRGSAANSIVAYLLGITGVDPIQHNLLFERFLHTGRRGMPDIDVDFETHRRHEVIEWMAGRFGEEHTAMTANVFTFRLRSAVREIAKTLGYPLPVIDKLSKILPHSSCRHVREHRNELALILGESPLLETLLCLVEQMAGCPRHLSQHSGGMILSRTPLRYVSPIQTSDNGVRQMQFNKDDVEAMGLIKFDVLGLRTLSVVTEAIDLLRDDTGRVLDVDSLPLDDEKTFELVRAGETMSVFQIESPGQWNLLSRTQPREFDDLVAQVALFRPGPLQGNMVHPYVQRRQGLQKVSYPHPSLEPVLRDTYGVILFQEQVLEVAHHFAGLTLSQADDFRRLMSKFRDSGQMESMRTMFVEGAVRQHKTSKHPVSARLANQVFDTVSKFVGYGFCRSHAAAFAHTVYQTAYLKAHHPAAYMAAVLEHHPGFYPLNTLIQEARHRGVQIRPVDIHYSDLKYRLESGAIRVPLTQVKGISPEVAASIVLERATAPFESLEDLYARIVLHRDSWLGLARSGAFDPFGERRQVLWKVGELVWKVGPSGYKPHDYSANCSTTKYSKASAHIQTSLVQTSLDLEQWHEYSIPHLRRLSQQEVTQWDFQTQGLTAGPHPVALHRHYLEQLGAVPIRHLFGDKVGSRVLTAGVVISRQRPPTAKGMCFIILEDESSRIPTAITPDVYEKYHRELREPSLLIEGKLEDSGPVATSGKYRSVLINRLWALQKMLGGHRGFPGEVAKSVTQ